MFNFQKERIEKLNRLRESGIQPYPHGIHISHSSHEVLALIGDRTKEELNEDITEVVVSGRLMFKNEMGKAGFAKVMNWLCGKS